jgi:carbamoyl-phosphate synthase large subunit
MYLSFPPPSANPGVLFTSAGRRIELLRAFRRAYEELGLQSRVIAVDIDPLAPALQVADRYFLVPSVDDPDYIPAVVEICRREQVTRVYPLIDPDVPVLTQHRDAIEATGAVLATIPAVTGALIADKWDVIQFFKSLDLLTPRSWLPEEIDTAQMAFPVFLKPRRGSASENAFKVRNERELRFFLEYVPRPIVQEFLPGPEITCDVVCDVDGDVLSVVQRQRIEVRGGEVVKGVTVNLAGLLDACVKIATHLQTRGPITVQCMLKDGQPHFTEINPRFGGGFPLGVAAGADSPVWLVARAGGISVDIPPLGSYQTGTYVSRFDDSFFLTEAEHEQMARHRFRSGRYSVPGTRLRR